jgi:hypothetical protein
MCNQLNMSREVKLRIHFLTLIYVGVYNGMLTLETSFNFTFRFYHNFNFLFYSLHYATDSFNS